MKASSARSRTDRTAHIWLVIAIVSLVALGLLSIALTLHVVLPLDLELLGIAISWRDLDGVWNLFSALGNLPMIPTGFGFAIWLLYRGRRREALLVVLLFAAATAGSEGLKAIVARERPLGSAPGIPGSVYSYPSGHALEDVMILGMIAVALWRRQRQRWLKVGFVILVTVFVAFVCIARAALDLHYPSDMLGGLLAGLGILGLYVWWTRPGAWADRPPLWGT
ncbi:MAG TPA: phosphatase PAP2 family protein [Candidatus Limnocylindrales bacterium]